MRCYHCKGNHETSAQVRTCATGHTFQDRYCQHEIIWGACVICKPRQRKTKGVVTLTSNITARWIDFDTQVEVSGWCDVCQGGIEPGDTIATRRSWRRWSHLHCFLNRAEIEYERYPATSADYRTQRTNDEPGYSPSYDRLQDLLIAADSLLNEALACERETTVGLLRQVAEDMDYDLSIDLIAETTYYRTPEQQGTLDPKEEEFDLDMYLDAILTTTDHDTKEYTA